MDVWNVSLYGDLTPHGKNNTMHEENAINILEEDHGRPIISLGNKFDHVQLKE
jgi:hypothetical protein